MRLTARSVFLVGVVLALVGGPFGAPPARAADGDRIISFAIAYTVRADGTVDVVEDIDYRFGSRGRHGIYRDLIVREPFAPNSDKDVEYGISNIAVSSPDASAKVSKSTDWHNPRTRWIRLKIGDKDVTISAQRAHYRISYRLSGALRTVNGVPEFYWNATGFGWDASIDEARITVQAPKGTTSLSCYWGSLGSTNRCQTATEGGSAVFTQTDLARKQGVTVSAQLPVGSVANATPTVVPMGTVWRRAHVEPTTLAGAGVALLLSVLAAIWAWRANRDRRFGGVAPGIVESSAPAVVDSVPKSQIPVRFNPPDYPAELAGAMVSVGASGRSSAATIADLAYLGAINIDAEIDSAAKYRKSGGLKRTAILVDRSRCRTPYQRAFLDTLIPPRASTLTLDKPGSKEAERFVKAKSALDRELIKARKSEGWVERPSGLLPAILAGFAGVGVVAFAIGVLANTGIGALVWLGFAVLIAAGLMVVAVRCGMGRRTPVGRAVTDQTEGFRTYLATAEARQLRFEEGEDIFSKYLPWAIMFNLADRWQQVCRELASAGRIPDHPAWYTGPAFYSSYEASSFGSSLNTSVSSASSSSSGSGGGGSAGGGGGGGGGGSW